MTASALHPWNVTPQEAKAIQNDLAAQVIRHNQFGEIKTVAGADIALDPETNTGYAGVIVYEGPPSRCPTPWRAEEPTTNKNRRDKRRHLDAIGCWHLGQYDLGLMIDCSIGIRWITTLRKLPTIRPKRNARPSEGKRSKKRIRGI